MTKWIVDGRVPRDSLTVMHGRLGTGKTSTALAMARAVAADAPWLGCATAPDAIVVYIADASERCAKTIVGIPAQVGTLDLLGDYEGAMRAVDDAQVTIQTRPGIEERFAALPATRALALAEWPLDLPTVSVAAEIARVRDASGRHGPALVILDELGPDDREPVARLFAELRALRHILGDVTLLAIHSFEPHKSRRLHRAADTVLNLERVR